MSSGPVLKQYGKRARVNESLLLEEDAVYVAGKRARYEVDAILTAAESRIRSELPSFDDTTPIKHGGAAAPGPAGGSPGSGELTTVSRDGVAAIFPMIQSADCTVAEEARYESDASGAIHSKMSQASYHMTTLLSRATPVGAMPPRTKASRAAGLIQTYLDFGQKRGDRQHCTLCGMIFNPGDIDESKSHKVFCERQSFMHVSIQTRDLEAIPAHLASTLPKSAARRLEMPSSITLARVKCHAPTLQGVVYAPRDLACLKKSRFSPVGDLLAAELGAESSPLLRDGSDVLVWCLTSRDQLVAALVTEIIDTAFLLDAGASGDGPPQINHSRPCKASLGVAQVWVHQHHRKQGFAALLLDLARAGAIYGHRITKDAVAFSQPTRFGRAFACRYAETASPLVY